MPIAGPISILVTSNALKGKRKYCNYVTLGASLADLVYVFTAVYGLTRFYSLYKPVIPYVLLVGALFLLYLGYKISKTKVDLDHIDDNNKVSGKFKKDRNGFLTGFLLNFLNPTLFLGWLTSSFIVISLVASLGFNTGGLNESVHNSFKTLNKEGEDTVLQNKTLTYLHLDSVRLVNRPCTRQTLQHLPKYFSLLLSAAYAFFLSLGSIMWFFYLAYLLSKYRQRINIYIINRIIQSLGIVLCLFSFFLLYRDITMMAGV